MHMCTAYSLLAMTKKAGFYTSGSFLSGRLFVPDSASSELYVMDAKVRSR